jgi:hypothetical protein
MTQTKREEVRRIFSLMIDKPDFHETLIFLGHNKEQDAYLLVLASGDSENIYCGIGHTLKLLDSKSNRFGFDPETNTELYYINNKQLHISRTNPKNATINRCPFRPLPLCLK